MSSAAKEAEAAPPNSASPQDVEGAHARCLDLLDSSLSSNLWLKHIVASMNSNGCEVTRQFFKCMPCKKGLATGFYDTKLGVVMCEDVQVPREVFNATLMHEAIHAYDYCRADMIGESCVHRACTEIRAATLSGECGYRMEMARGSFHVHKHFPACVRRRAELALSTGPCGDVAASAVNRAWEGCYSDKAPFGFIPKV